ncbi:MAG TPA: ABC transporter permease subunit [Fibrobacteria bacterium]|nr:ABC transporter permease subunit [Fibrobacteria bacterium]
MKFPARSALALLVVLLALPVLALLCDTARLLVPPSPRIARLRDGSRILAIPLPPSRPERARGVQPALLGDGSIRVLEGMPSSLSVDTEAWLVRRDDGPLLMGRLSGVVTEDGDTLRGPSARQALEEMPSRLGGDRNRLARRIPTDGGKMRPGQAARSLALFDAEDRRVVGLFSDLDGTVRPARLSSIRDAERAPSGLLDGIRQTVPHLGRLLLEAPDAWDGGGLEPVVAGTLALVLLSGLVGGLPALLAALQLADRTDPGLRTRWVRSSSEWFAAVPGVVWGVIGAGVLVGGMGVHLDSIFASGVRWGTGGMLWGAITLGALSAPVTLARAMSAIDRVPRSWREIARSCGATRWQVLRRVILPASARGLVGAWFSGLARAAGETAPLFLVGAARAIGRSGVGSAPAPSLSGGFLHLGVLACDPPWPPSDGELGRPLAFLSLSLLALLCVGLEYAAVRLLLRREPEITR